MTQKSRNTKQKELIQKEIDKMNSFFYAEDLYKKVKSKDGSLGIATVYRFLREEKERGNLYSYLCDRKFLYSKGKKNHCHFYCEETKKTIHFEIDDLSFLKNKVPGKINSIQLEVKGVCDTCSK